MKHIIIGFIAILMITGCVTLPKPVEEVYLSEMTADESAKLDKIGAEIIAKNNNRDKADKEVEIAKQRREVTKKEITALDASNELILEKEKLYSLTEENSRIADIQKQKEKNTISLNQAKAYLKYIEVKNETTAAFLEVKKAELAVSVAQLDYEKALIAKTYQLKRAEEFKDKMIDDVTYKKFLDNQKVKLEESEKTFDKSSRDLAKAEEELKKKGYEVEK